MKWLLVLGLINCGGDDGIDQCVPPTKVTYACQPIANGMRGCVGGPTNYPMSLGPVDTDKTFPIGCVATLPACSTFPDPLSVQCVDASTPGWTTPGL